MTIASEIQRIKTNIANAYDALETAGATMPATENSANLALTVATVPAGGDEITATNTTGSAVSADDRVWVNGVNVYTPDFSFTSYYGTNIVNNTSRQINCTSAGYQINCRLKKSEITPPTSSLEICMKIRQSFIFSGYSGYCGCFGNPDIGLSEITTGAHLRISSGRAVWNIENGTNYYASNETISTNTWYWFKLLATGSEIVSSVSMDGTNWTTVYSDNIGVNFSNLTLYDNVKFGFAGSTNSSNTDTVDIDLSECYVKVDGNTIWTPYTTSTTYSIINDTDITSTSFTGVAQANIANNATGSVKTLLDGNGTYAPTTTTKTITTNGTYTASAENAYGLSSVTVNVPTPDTWYNWKTNTTTTATDISMPSSATYRQMAFGNNKFVVLASTGIAYSSDGETNWTFSSTITGLYGIIFDGTKFVAVGTNKTAYSLDGINWTENTNSQDLRIVAYTNNKYVAINNSADSDTYMYSEDGINWQAKQLPAMYGMTYVCGGNGKFIITLGRSSNTNVAIYSEDGLAWSNVTLPSSGSWKRVVYGNGKFVAIRGNGTVDNSNIGAYSEDGLTWSNMTLPSSGTWSALGYGNGIFVAAKGYNNTSYRSNLGAFSYDGINWTELSLYSYTFWSYVCYGDGKFILNGGDSYSTYKINKVTISTSSAYTLTSTPTTSTQVYEIPKKTSALTITAVGTGTITLSDSKVYNRNSTGDVQSPVLGTKTITSNDTYTAASDYLDGFSSVTVDVPSAPTKKYNLLDRVKDDSNNEIGTVSGFFTDANNVEYAVVCLDAQYRLDGGNWCSNASIVRGLPLYDTAQWGPWEAKETATFNTQKILGYCTTMGFTSGACSHCRTLSFTIDGTTYYGQLPNMIELNDIVRNHTAINTADTTAGSYSSVDFSTGRNSWSSSQYSSGDAWYAGHNGPMSHTLKTNTRLVIPVLEIPNT